MHLCETSARCEIGSGFETAKDTTEGSALLVKILDLSGALASIIGLGVAVWTLYQAIAAKKAAMQAREAVRLGNAAEDFRALNQLASEFLGYVEGNQIDAAAIRARDLLAGILSAKQRWTRFLSTERITKLEGAGAQVSVISRSLLTKGAPTTLAERQRLLKFSQDVVKIVAEETGTITSESELRN